MPPTDAAPGVWRGRAACRAALADLLLARLAPGADGSDTPPADLLLIDNDFAAWPLDEPALHQALAQWLRPAGRRLRIVARDVDAVARQHPRLARWRRDWVHRIEVLQPVDGVLPSGLRLLLAERVALQWLDAPDWRLRQVTDPVHLAALHDQSADFLQRCGPAWPVTTLGL